MTVSDRPPEEAFRPETVLASRRTGRTCGRCGCDLSRRKTVWRASLPTARASRYDDQQVVEAGHGGALPVVASRSPSVRVPSGPGRSGALRGGRHFLRLRCG